MMFYTYVILCRDGSYYKGFTKNLRRRFEEHVLGKGSKHTKKYKPVKIAYYETFETEQEAIAREKYFKSGSGREWLKKHISTTDQMENVEAQKL